MCNTKNRHDANDNFPQNRDHIDYNISFFHISRNSFLHFSSKSLPKNHQIQTQTPSLNRFASEEERRRQRQEAPHGATAAAAPSGVGGRRGAGFWRGKRDVFRCVWWFGFSGFAQGVSCLTLLFSAFQGTCFIFVRVLSESSVFYWFLYV